jgi:hypothetical protein
VGPSKTRVSNVLNEMRALQAAIDTFNQIVAPSKVALGLNDREMAGLNAIRAAIAKAQGRS